MCSVITLVFFKRCYFYIAPFFCCFFIVTNGQILKIKDSISAKPIRYAKIIVNNTTFYSDSLGIFRVNSIPDNSVFSIQKFGYEDKNISFKNVDADVFLKEKVFEIPEVKLSQKKKITIGKEIKKATTKIGVLKEIEIGTLIINPYNVSGLLKSITLPIKKNSFKRGYIVINFYEISKNENAVITIINEDPIVIPLSEINRHNNKIDLLSKKIVMPSNSLLIGVSILDNIGEYSKKSDIPVIEMYNSINMSNPYLKKTGESWKMYSLKTKALNYILEVLF